MGKKGSLGKQHSLRFKKWMADDIEEIAESRGLTFTDVVEELLRRELNLLGYTIGIGNEADSKKEKPAKKKAG